MIVKSNNEHSALAMKSPKVNMADVPRLRTEI